MSAESSVSQVATAAIPYEPFQWCSALPGASSDRRKLCDLVNTVIDVTRGAAVVVDLTQECDASELPMVSKTDLGSLNRLAIASLRLLRLQAENVSSYIDDTNAKAVSPTVAM